MESEKPADADQHTQFYSGRKMGIKSFDGRIVVPAVYDFVAPYSDGVFHVFNGDAADPSESGYVGLDGKLLFPLTKELGHLCDFSEGLAAFYRDGRYGFIDKKGRVVIEPRFVFAEKFQNGLSVVRGEDDLHGAIDVSGRLVVPHAFPALFSFNDAGYAVFGRSLDGPWGLVDRTGREVCPPRFAAIEFQADGECRVVVEKEDGDLQGGIFDPRTGETAWDASMDHLNRRRRAQADLEAAFKGLLDFYAERGCPCRFPRYRRLVEFSRDVKSSDGELLFTLSAERFPEPVDEGDATVFRCPKCSSRHVARWKEFNAFYTVIQVEIELSPAATDLGAPVSEPFPVALGFVHLETVQAPPAESEFTQRPLAEVIAYLKEPAR